MANVPVVDFQPAEFLHSKYKKGWVNNTLHKKKKLIINISVFGSVSTAIFLAAYIIDLILVLYEISMMVTVNLTESLSSDLVMNALATYQPRSSDIHTQVKGAAFTFKFDSEEKIAAIIQEALPRSHGPPLHR